MEHKFLNDARFPFAHKDMVERIKNWNLDVVKKRLIQTEGLNPDQVDRMEAG